MEKDSSLFFIEVKYRRSDAFGSAEEAVDGAKLKKLYNAALDYACDKNIEDVNMRFAAVCLNERHGKVEISMDDKIIL